MRVPLQWLKQYVDVQASAEEIATRLTMGGLEVEGVEDKTTIFERLIETGVSESRARAAEEIGPVLDVYITPNRGDCLSMVGVAREVAALYDLPLRVPEPPGSYVCGGGTGQTEATLLPAVSINSGDSDQQAEPLPLANNSGPVKVSVEDPQLCPRYAARIVRGVQIGPSPEWMQARLEAAGQRPINNVVDVTNYVMLELGQPMHAFDLAKLAGGRIVVRLARPGETLTTLDDVDRALSTQMLVIADAERAVAVAGVMGGEASEVSDATTDLLLESAHFDPLTVRRTARALGLRTEASYRFERIVDPNGVLRALDRACELLAEIGQPTVVPGVIDVYPTPIRTTSVTLRPYRLAVLLGIEISANVAADCLTRLGFRVNRHNDSERLDVDVPTFRPDIRLEEDLIEEVGRIYGYENIPETLPIGATTRGGDSEEGRLLMRIRELLVGVGLQEVVTHSLTAPSFFEPPQDAERRRDAIRVPVRNVLSSEVSGLRVSLLPALIDVAQRNAARGQNALALFEIGRVWHNDYGTPCETLSVAGLLSGPLIPASWQTGGKAQPADFATVRGVVVQLLGELHIPSWECQPIPELISAVTHFYDVSRRSGQPNPDFEQKLAYLGAFHPGRTASIQLLGAEDCGILGELHPRRAADLSLRDRILLFEIPLEVLRSAMPAGGPKFEPLSPFPSVTRDLAPRVSAALPYVEVEAAVLAAKPPLVEEYRLVDLYTGPPLPEGTKSLTLSFTFRSAAHTLKEAEINAALNLIRDSLVTRCGAEFAA